MFLCKECGYNVFDVEYTDGKTEKRVSGSMIDFDDDIFCITCRECENSWYKGDLNKQEQKYHRDYFDIFEDI